jgi:hypothetical protein
MINWPAVIKYEGDDELTHVSSEKAWLRDAATLLYNHSGDDQLIDSSGQIFNLDSLNDNKILTVDTGQRITVAALIRLVRIHASSSHRCCIEKISFHTIAEGISLVDSMNETQ